MKNYIVLFREPDGRALPHSEEEISRHRQNWQAWMEKWGVAGNLAGGSGLTLEGRIIRGADTPASKGLHSVGTEVVGGFLLLKADSLDEATDIARTCPIYEFNGYAEVREMQ